MAEPLGILTPGANCPPDAVLKDDPFVISVFTVAILFLSIVFGPKIDLIEYESICGARAPLERRASKPSSVFGRLASSG